VRVMARGNLGLAVVLLATVSGSMALMAPDTGTARKSSSASVAGQSLSQVAATAKPSTSEYFATEILKQFLYGQDMKLSPGQDPKEALGKIIHDRSDPRFQYYVDSIIATLPDPIETGLSVTLDDEIDAIQRAAESEGYVLDRYKLPWPTARRARGEGRRGRDRSV
jgi:hypothetical protein